MTAQVSGINGFIHFTETNLTFDQVMEGFEKRTGYYIQYDAGLIPSKKKFDVKYLNIKARQALTDFLAQNGLDFTISGKQIILKKAIRAEATKKYLLSGRVSQKQSGELIGYAELHAMNNGNTVFTSEAGYFSMFLSKDTNIIRISFPGFKIMYDTILGDRNYFMNYALEMEPFTMPTAEISGHSKNAGTQTFTEGQTDQYLITKEKMKRLPHLLGEPDILRVMSLYPGIVGGSEGMMGMYIRGGASDQNLVLLDDVPVFNSYHLYGIFSIFNDEMVKSANLLKSSFPARYGGRLSSVVNVQTKEGNEYRIKGSFNIGLMASKLFLEGPIIKNRTTFTLAFRRSYVDFLTKPAARLFFANDSLPNNVYYFWDINARITHRFSSRSRLSLSFYAGGDVGGIDEKTSSQSADVDINSRKQQLSSWGNILGSIKWNYYFGKRTGLLVKAHVTGYNYSFNQNYRLKKTFTDKQVQDVNDYTEYKLQNGIKDFEGSFILTTKVSKGLSINMGGGYTLHQFIPGNRSLTSDISGNNTVLTFNDPQVKTPEYFGFVEVEGKAGKHLYYNLGLRNSWFVLDKTHYYILPEPRINLRYKFRKNTWAKLSAMRTWQFFHQLTNLTLGLPSDLWVPSTINFEPSRADQISAGFSTSKEKWQFSSEVFYKKLYNLLEYKDNAGYITSAQNWENAVTSGGGEAYGWEAMVEKTKGRLTGWLSYTLMWNQRQFDALNHGNTFPARYDRRHNIYLATVYKINNHVDFAMAWTYNSGFATTLPVGKYSSPTPNDPYRTIFIYGNRNNTRTRDNHRLDIAFNFEKQKSGYIRTWSVGVFNAYNRRNTFYVTLGLDKQGNPKPFEVSLLPILPNVSYKITF